jgi:hypothetical protein
MTARSRCAWCPEPAVDAHHLTGRHPDRSYLDLELTVPLCHAHHEIAHADLRCQRLDNPTPEVAARIGRIAFCLARLAVFFGRFATTTGHAWFEQLASALRTWADDLADAQHTLTPA